MVQRGLKARGGFAGSKVRRVSPDQKGRWARRVLPGLQERRVRRVLRARLEQRAPKGQQALRALKVFPEFRVFRAIRDRPALKVPRERRGNEVHRELLGLCGRVAGTGVRVTRWMMRLVTKARRGSPMWVTLAPNLE